MTDDFVPSREKAIMLGLQESVAKSVSFEAASAPGQMPTDAAGPPALLVVPG